MSFSDFLQRNKASHDCTHTRIGDISSNIYPGKYKFEDKEEEFYQKIYREVIVNLKKEYLTEKQRVDGTLVVDLDFRYKPYITTRQHKKEDIQNIVIIFLEEIKKLVKVDSEFHVFVMEKQKVNLLADKTKDGIHFVFTFDTERRIQRELRLRVVEKLKSEGIINLPLINTWDDVYDKGISDGTTNWMIFGCRKPEHDVYAITNIYHCEIDPIDNEFMINPRNVESLISFDTFYNLSVRKPKQVFTALQKINAINHNNIVAQGNNANCDIELEESNKSKYIDLLFNVIGNGSHIQWSEWFQIAAILKCNGFDFEVLRKYTNIFDNENPKTESIWKSIDANRVFPLRILESLAKRINPDMFKIWKGDYGVKFISIKDLEDVYTCSKIVSKTLKSKLKLCKELWYMLDECTQLWSIVKDPHRIITKEIRKYIDYSNLQTTKQIKETDGDQKEKLIKASECYLAHYNIINRSSYSTSFLKNLKDLLRDNYFDEKLDKNPGKLAFLNGVMDLETKVFRVGLECDDYLTNTIQYSYEESSKEKTEFVKSVLKKILNNNDEHLEYFLSVLGYTFIGKPNLEKSMYFMIDGTDNGKGDNGKTFFFDVLDYLMPYYVKKSNSSFIELGNTKLHKQLSGTKATRLLWIDEISRVKELDPVVMKELANGQKKENEVMYGTTENINILFKMFILSNFIPKIDPEDEAAFNRYKQITFGSHFDRKGIRKEENDEKLEYIADTTLADKFKIEYKNEIFNLIIDYAHNYYLYKMPTIPEKFNKDADKAKEENDAFAFWFHDNCKEDLNGKIALQNIKELSGFNEKLIKNGMKRLHRKYLRDLSGMGKDNNGKPYKGGYEGICWI